MNVEEEQFYNSFIQASVVLSRSRIKWALMSDQEKKKKVGIDVLHMVEMPQDTKIVNALTDPQRVRTPAISEYWKPLAEDMDLSAGIEAEYHHKNNRVDGLTHKHLGSIGLHSI
ncbi:THO complex subunit 1 [Vitis vinifera]|uniref:THO complex subunit 1 n=1 Tax=Vitis vinifera TaxID=29760 RepID=A0A438IJQ0_VITVI|nr:THO complex subunit 1 [Vitis vinifera]